MIRWRCLSGFSPLDCTVDLAAVRGSFVCPRSPLNYLPKDPWLAETFESP